MIGKYVTVNEVRTCIVLYVNIGAHLFINCPCKTFFVSDQAHSLFNILVDVVHVIYEFIFQYHFLYACDFNTARRYVLTLSLA